MRTGWIWNRGCKTLFLSVIVLALLALLAERAGMCDADLRQDVYNNTKSFLKLVDSMQAPGGTIVFSINGLDGQPSKSVTAGMRLQDPKASKDWLQLMPIRLGETEDKSGILYSVTIPADFKLPSALDSIFPAADLKVTVAQLSPTQAPVMDAVRTINLSRRWLALFAALVFVAVAAFILYRFALFLNVPGTGVLLIISSANGWASLAQFQILLWTLVIGGGAVYVMILKGPLIEITNGALWLLGISGAATLGSQLKSSQQAQSVQAFTRPGKIDNLAPADRTESEVTLSWQTPSDGGAPDAYTVQYREKGDAYWSTAGSVVNMRRFRLVGLKPDTDYDLQVFATNAAGSGPPAPSGVHTEKANISTPVGVGGLGSNGSVASDSVPLRWDAVEGAKYRVEYRAHDSDEPWRNFGEEIDNPSVTVSGLTANTFYDFRVFADTSVTPSDIYRETTGPRKPRWSDIVTDTNRPAEIDVTRVQMLFFTVISAFFVAKNIYFGGVIPEIPSTYVTLMGISNGVYITAKFVGR